VNQIESQKSLNSNLKKEKKSMLNKFKKMLTLHQKNTSLILSVAAIILLTIAYEIDNSLSPHSNTKSENQELDSESADTIIPKGFVLVPIEIQNIDSLNSLVGPYSMVDLFTTSAPNQKPGNRVGRKLKLLRAPLNPQSYAVLVPEKDASTLMASQGPYVAVIQNPNQTTNSEITKKQDRPAAVTYLHRSKDESTSAAN
jgi:hypothetical protein